MDQALLTRVVGLAQAFLKSLPERPVGARASFEELRAALDRPLSEDGIDPTQVIEDLARDVDPGLIASAGPRYFGYVIGGSYPVALAADWLTSTWDQNAGVYTASPAAAVVESVAASWLLDLFGLPPSSGVGFVTGTQMASFTALAAARHEVLLRHGWDVERDGLYGAPRIQVVVGGDAHTTIFKALRLLGLGSGAVKRVPADSQGRLRADALRESLEACDGPTIVCAQAGNVNTGSFDPLPEIATAARERGAWLHVDGAFGLWAAASPRHRHLIAGVERADSWVTDGHKWLNVPYDSGVVIVANAEALRSAMAVGAAYIARAGTEARDAIDWGPDFSRRARGFAVYATLRALGRRGVADLVERTCALAGRMAERLAEAPEVEILNEVVLNQVLVGVRAASGGDADSLTRAVIERVQRDGTCWLGGTTVNEKAALRISISNPLTTESDVDRSAVAILRAIREGR